MTGSAGSTDLRRLQLRFAGRCVLCGAEISKKAWALYDQRAKKVRCIECPTKVAEPACHGADLDVADDTKAAFDGGIAGASARREYERRKAAREARVKDTVGNFVGGVLLALTDEPQHIRAWERGASGEQKLANALEGVDGLRILHDRRVPRTRGNIDHIVIAAAGVFVVDAKNYKGLIDVRDRGGLLSRVERLYVGRQDCSHLADNMGWQVETVQDVLRSTGYRTVPVVPVLCFVDGEWPLLFPPSSYKGVHLEGMRSIKRLVARTSILDRSATGEVSNIIAAALPSK